MDVLVLTSHPFAALLSQSPKGALQVPIRHTPAVHVGVPLTTAQTVPQTPQLRTSSCKLTHIIAPAPPQIALGAGQSARQIPVTHSSPMAQARPHIPQ